MIQQGVPFDGIGHQFHVSLTTASSNLDDALTDMSSLGKKQAITELDVATGTPVTEAKLIEQGRYYYDVNQIIHRHADQLFSVSVWGAERRPVLAQQGGRAAAVRREPQP